MPYKDLHDKPFDAETITKLGIFEEYAKAWIPTFVMTGYYPTICIFDLFAGTGYDKDCVAGSPIRILQQIKNQIGNIFQKKTEIKVYFNEYDKEKFKQLTEACKQFLDDNKDVGRAIELNLSNEDFDICFTRLLPEIAKFPSLVYLDQNGVKFLSDKYLLPLEKTEKTDFLYFVSASQFKRFGETDEFKKHFPNINLEEIKNNPYQFIHRNLIAQLRGNLPQNSKLKLYPFSIKKGVNIHGIIFGAKSPRAFDKFLDVAWEKSPVNGDANFDIDGDVPNAQLSIFGEKKLTKIESFQEALLSKIKEAGTITNGEIYLFTLEKGHPKSHASNYLKELKKQKNKTIDYNSKSPKIHYDGLTKQEERVEIKWVGK